MSQAWKILLESFFVINESQLQGNLTRKIIYAVEQDRGKFVEKNILTMLPSYFVTNSRIYVINFMTDFFPPLKRRARKFNAIFFVEKLLAFCVINKFVKSSAFVICNIDEKFLKILARSHLFGAIMCSKFYSMGFLLILKYFLFQY